MERTFYGLMLDYEATENSAENWIYIAMIRIQLRIWLDSSTFMFFQTGSNMWQIQTVVFNNLVPVKLSDKGSER